jgi:hypothetical protein
LTGYAGLWIRTLGGGLRGLILAALWIAFTAFNAFMAYLLFR